MGSHMTEGDAFEREPRTRWLGRRYANNEFSFSPGRENTHALHVRRGRHLAGDRMARSTSGDRGIRADFARSGRTKGERVYTLDGVQHSSQCHVHTRKCAERDEGERPRAARQERWREDWIYGTVPTVRNSPLLPKVVCIAKGAGPRPGGHSGRGAVRSARSHPRASGVDWYLREDEGQERITDRGQIIKARLQCFLYGALWLIS